MADLREEVNYYKGLDAQRDAALTAACQADPRGPGCLTAMKSAFEAQGWWDPSAGDPFAALDGPDGYRMMRFAIERMGEDAYFASISHPDERRAVWEEYKQTQALLAQFPDAVNAAWHDTILDMGANAIIAAIPGFGKGPYARGGRASGLPDSGFGANGEERIVNNYGPLNEGPLRNDIARTFRSSTYSEVVTTEPIKLYRVISDNGNPAGGYWTRTKPEGPVQSVIDSALDQNWGNTATRILEMDVPVGTKLFEGAAAPQRGLVGGGNQIFFDRNINPLDPAWIK